MSAFRTAIYPQVLMNFGPMAISETLYCSIYPKERTKSTQESEWVANRIQAWLNHLMLWVLQYWSLCELQRLLPVHRAETNIT
jgi:hypothetical protein